MIEKDDVRAAVQAGILNEAQAASLMQLSHARAGARRDLPPSDEPFELFKGFNEIFIVVGLVVLAIGWGILVTTLVTIRTVDLNNTALILGAVAAVMLWCLAEYFIRARRMIAPSIALTVLFAFNSFSTLNIAYSAPIMVGRGDLSTLVIPTALSCALLALFWWRFRVPFALAVISLGVYSVTLLVASGQSENAATFATLFQLSADGPFAWITLALGTVIFAAAMAFDMSDPHRVTRRSANGFWLHVLAAPALVNTIALTLLQREDMTATLLLLLVLVLFAIVAIVIDRRSFLIAATGYVVALTVTIFEDYGAAWSVLGLGIGLLVLGAFWEVIRAQLLRVIPGLPLGRLPPAQLTKD